MMRVLVACEESQAVTTQFRAIGVEAYSCDILPCSGGHPEWHIQGDVSPLLRIKHWDIIIAFPPCTHLACSGARWFAKKQTDGRQQQGIDFFMQFVNSNYKRVAIENPVGIMSTMYRKPDQIIQPYEYGDPYEKRTCLWLRGLPKLLPTIVVQPPARIVFTSGKSMPKWCADTYNLPAKERAVVRSKTFPGIAKAMVTQWVDYLRTKS